MAGAASPLASSRSLIHGRIQARRRAPQLSQAQGRLSAGARVFHSRCAGRSAPPGIHPAEVCAFGAARRISLPRFARRSVKLLDPLLNGHQGLRVDLVPDAVALGAHAD